MDNKIPDQDRIAYSEIVYLLNTMDESYIQKVPKELLDFFNAAKMDNYNVHIDKSLPQYTDNFKEYTVEIFNVLNLNFWCKDEFERKNAIIYLLDKTPEFKLNKQIGDLKGGTYGNYFEEILNEAKEKEKAIELFKLDVENLKRAKKNEHENIDKPKTEKQKEETLFTKIKKIFKK